MTVLIFREILLVMSNVIISIGLDSAEKLRLLFFFFFWDAHLSKIYAFLVGFLHCLQDLQTSFLAKLSLKIGHTILFTYLKIILL